MKKNICFITGSRAEFGLQKQLIEEINNEKVFNLQLLVTGSHLSKYFNNTYKDINDQGIKISKKIKILPNKKEIKTNDIINSVATSFNEFRKFFEKNNTNIIVIFGDRYEMIAPSYVALFMKIPLAHIHGGEITNGSLDDSIRHTISKLSKLHFVANQNYKKRVIQLGENPKNVYVVGGLAADKISNYNFLKKNEIEKNFNFQFNKINFLVTIHPETNNKNKIKIDNLLNALNEINDCFIIFTGVNADSDGFYIKRKILNFVQKNKNKSIYIESMGDKYYLSAMLYVNAVIGNSSSGIVEAPYFKIPTINIGSRQDGRLFADSIINCRFVKKEIISAINKIKSNNFKNVLKNMTLPYGKSGASKKICKILKNNINLTHYKKFYDL